MYNLMEEKKEEIDYSKMIDPLNEQIKKSFDLSRRQVEKLVMFPTEIWSIIKETDHLIMLDNMGVKSEYYCYYTKNNGRCTFISCTFAEGKEKCFVFRNSNYKRNIYDTLTIYERNGMVDKLNNEDVDLLTKKFMEELGIDVRKELNEEELKRSDELLINFCKEKDFDENKGELKI